MSKHHGKVTESNGSFYALIVRVDNDGQESVIHGYKGRHFKTRRAAYLSISKYLAKIGA